MYFDVADKTVIPSNFTTQVEKTVRRVIRAHYSLDIDMSLFEYVWSTSSSDTKFSKHLVVNNMYFDNWLP